MPTYDERARSIARREAWARRREAARPPRVGDRRAAEEAFRRAMKHLAGGDTFASQAALSEAIRLDPDFMPAYHERGNLRQLHGDLIGAIDDYSSALRLDNGSPEAHNNRGHAYLLLGRVAEAADDFSRALRLDPGRWDYWVHWAALVLFRHHPRAALAVLEHVVEGIEPPARGKVERMIARLRGRIERQATRAKS